MRFAPSYSTSVYVEYGYLSDTVYASNTQYIFPSSTTVYGFSSYIRFGNTALALLTIFLLVKILLSLDIELVIASLISLFFTASINLSQKPTWIPEFPS